MREYANLTNGLACAPQSALITRLPSTWCEQKLWDQVTTGVGPQMLRDLANGTQVVVHDQSERQRLTRAQWQGLSWLRYACSRAWNMQVPLEKDHQGMAYEWSRRYIELKPPTVAWLEYFTPSRRIARVDLVPCACPRMPYSKVKEAVDARRGH